MGGNRQYLPFVLHEATVNLYEAKPDGTANLQAPVWFGCRAHGINLVMSWEEVQTAASGATARTAHQLNEEHTMDFERVWVVPRAAMEAPTRSAMVEFVPTRNARFVLHILWHDRESGLGCQRIYWGVSFRGESLGAGRSWQQSQKLRAERMTAVPGGC